MLDNKDTAVTLKNIPTNTHNVINANKDKQSAQTGDQRIYPKDKPTIKKIAAGVLQKSFQ